MKRKLEIITQRRQCLVIEMLLPHNEIGLAMHIKHPTPVDGIALLGPMQSHVGNRRPCSLPFPDK
jgi:hypothetical protein